MALLIHSSPFSANKPSLFLSKSTHLSTKTRFLIRSQNPSSEPQNPSKPTTGPSSSLSQPNKPSSSGLGFGPSSSSSSASAKPVTDKKRKKQKTSTQERASVIRRSPVDKPAFLSAEGEGESAADQRKDESAFILLWLGLGLTILIEGLVLAASGFLPEEMDNFLAKYLYPTFTPTVILFLAGGVGYGVLKYLQNEELKGKN